MKTLPKNMAINYEVAPHILVMEDDLSVAKGLEMVLSEEGFDVNLAGTGELAMQAFRQKRFDLLVADLRLLDIDGMEVIKQVKAQKPETEVIVITGYGTIATAVEAMKLGVHDFLPKPFTDDAMVAKKGGPVTGRTTFARIVFALPVAAIAIWCLLCLPPSPSPTA